MNLQPPDSLSPTSSGLTDRIEILPVTLLDEHRHLVKDLKKTAHSFGLEFGWHYLLDLTWILHQLGNLQGKQIMDAGAGTGIIQWYMALQGAEVLSVDRTSRAGLPLRFRSRVQVEGVREQDLQSPEPGIHMQKTDQAFIRRLPSKIKNLLQNQIDLQRRPNSAGKVRIYNQDLNHLPDIPENSLDAVVAVSALEHNTPEGLVQVVKEIERVLKPGGMLLATLGTARDQDWWHQPSSGWCYTDASLRKLFDLPKTTSSNYAAFDVIMHDLENCAELRDNLASFYYKSENNGMPWGKWDPKYPPVGVRKVKPLSKP